MHGETLKFAVCHLRNVVLSSCCYASL